MKNEYLYSKSHDSISSFFLEPNSVYIFGHSLEQRSLIDIELKKRTLSSNYFIQIEIVDRETIIDTETSEKFLIKSPRQIRKLLQKYKESTLYLDVTGLDNRICSALIKNAIDCYKEEIFSSIRVIYCEPLIYNIKSFKSESVFNDLSEQIEGIEPLPGFATIFSDEESEMLLVALLGFEGGRFTHILENVQPSNDKVIPIIGVPGFRLEYPFVAFWGNQQPLKETGSWRKVEYAAANSLVEVYFLLENLLKKNPHYKIKLAPIGTKPHAIGAMLFAIKYPRQVEIVYDNPIRKKSRSEGVGNIIECVISKLIES